MVWLTGEQFKPTEYYASEVKELTEKADKLQADIDKLDKEKQDLISNNAEILKDKIILADKMKVEAQNIKQESLNGSLELHEKQKQFELDRVSLQDKIASLEIKNDNFIKKVNDINAEFAKRESDIQFSIQLLKSAKVADEEEKQNIASLRAQMAKETNDWNNAKVAFDEQSAAIEASMANLNQANIEFGVKYAEYTKSNAEMIKQMQDFEDVKNETNRKNADTLNALELINKKSKDCDAAIIQNSKILSDTTNKINILQAETQKHQEAIVYLTNLKTELVKQGETNVSKNT